MTHRSCMRIEIKKCSSKGVRAAWEESPDPLGESPVRQAQTGVTRIPVTRTV